MRYRPSLSLLALVVALAACRVERASAAPAPTALALNLTADCDTTTQACYLLSWTWPSDGLGNPDGFIVTVARAGTSGTGTVSVDTADGSPWPVRVARPAVGSSLTFVVSVAPVRRGLVGQVASLPATTITRADAAPPAVTDLQLNQTGPGPENGPPAPDVGGDSLTSALLVAPRDTSPHWSFITTMMTDFYYGWTPTERTWAARHYDAEMSGDGAAWRAINASVQTYPYTLAWSTLVADSVNKPNLTGTYYPDMQQWYAAHPQYRIETAFLHDSLGADSAHRLSPTIWNSRRWVLDPGDSGAVAYTSDRLARVAATASAGVFVDETGTGDILGRVAGGRERSGAAFLTAYAALIAHVHAAIAPQRLLLNTSAYMTDADFADAVAAGGVHLEGLNNPLHSGLPAFWTWVDRLIAAGVWVDFVSAYAPIDMPALARKGYGADSTAAFDRLRLAQLASYYLVVPADPGKIALQLENSWDRPYSSIWLAAQQVDIGHPTEARHVVAGLPTQDAEGNAVLVYERAFTHGVVLLRAQSGWGAQTYGDSTAVVVPLPAGGPWAVVTAAGGAIALDALRLRNAEAAIVVHRPT